MPTAEPFVIELPIVKETPGTVVYGLSAEQRTTVPLSTVYIRKDALAKNAAGNWPSSVTVMVEVHP